MIWPAQVKFIGIALGAALLAASHWYAYESGNTNGANEVRVKDQQQYIGVLLKRTSENVALAQQYRDQAKKANQDHEQELAAIHADAVRTAGSRVRIDPSRVCVPAPAGASQTVPAGSDGQADAGAFVLQQAFADNLRRLADEANEVAADLRTLKTQSAACFD